MTVSVIKSERVVSTILGLLERDSVLSRMLWRDPAGDFRGARGDAITIRLPAYTKAKSRLLRSGDARVASSLTERKVIVELTHDLYERVEITDEELTLDIENFDRQVTVPVAKALVRGIEDASISLVENATYDHTVNFDHFPRPYDALIRARRHLNDSRVPDDGRALVVGSAVDELLLTDDLFVRADQSGSDEALRNAQTGRIAGVNVYQIPGLDPGSAFMFHQTAYVLSTRAPMVPRGAPWGTTMDWEGFAMRVVMAIDPEEVVDNFNADTWYGTNIVEDYGTINGDGFFEPTENPDVSQAPDVFVRAVKLTGGS